MCEGTVGNCPFIGSDKCSVDESKSLGPYGPNSCFIDNDCKGKRTCD